METVGNFIGHLIMSHGIPIFIIYLLMKHDFKKKLEAKNGNSIQR